MGIQAHSMGMIHGASAALGIGAFAVLFATMGAASPDATGAEQAATRGKLFTGISAFGGVATFGAGVSALALNKIGHPKGAAVALGIAFGAGLGATMLAGTRIATTSALGGGPSLPGVGLSD